jgi:hypothetical protein
VLGRFRALLRPVRCTADAATIAARSQHFQIQDVSDRSAAIRDHPRFRVDDFISQELNEHSGLDTET